MSLAISKAKSTGVAIVSAKRTNHFGMAGFYSEMAAKEGLIGMAFVNANPLVHKFGFHMFSTKTRLLFVLIDGSHPRHDPRHRQQSHLFRCPRDRRPKLVLSGHGHHVRCRGEAGDEEKKERGTADGMGRRQVWGNLTHTSLTAKMCKMTIVKIVCGPLSEREIPPLTPKLPFLASPS